MAFLLEMSSIQSKIDKRFEQNLSIHGISLTEFLVLHELHNAPQQTMSRIALATAVGLSASGVTRLLNPLEKMHFVEKQKNQRDARMSLVKLSETGVQIYSDASSTYSNVADDLLALSKDAKLPELLEIYRGIS